MAGLKLDGIASTAGVLGPCIGFFFFYAARPGTGRERLVFSIDDAEGTFNHEAVVVGSFGSKADGDFLNFDGTAVAFL